ncbi:MAG: hypothetical protein DCC67_12535 [Planctomycetota bacterium]|nr:MAG: hypothetical protein DCC67_12535 [Planctomycetota bacterium]
MNTARRGAWRSACLLIAAGLTLPVAAGEVKVANRNELNAALQRAEAGDVILLAPGAYPGGVAATGLRGRQGQPVVIAAADPDHPPVITGGASGLQLSSPQHVEIRGLAFAGANGNGLNIDDGGDVDAPARHVVVRHVTVRDIGPAGNCDGIKLSGVEDFQVLDCRLERWGSGGSAIDMVGCRRGLIQGCCLVGRGGEQASGIQTKGGTSRIAIRRCRIVDAGARGVNIGGSTGLDYFRPPDAPFEARDIAVEDCEIIGGHAAVAFVGVDGATVRHNTIYRPQTWAVRILQETVAERFVPCRRGVFAKNLVLFRSDELRRVFNVGDNTDPQSFQFADNAWSCLDKPDETEQLVNLPAPEQRGVYGPPPPLADPQSGDFTLRNRRPDDPGARTRSEPDRPKPGTRM